MKNKFKITMYSNFKDDKKELSNFIIESSKTLEEATIFFTDIAPGYMSYIIHTSINSDNRFETYKRILNLIAGIFEGNRIDKEKETNIVFNVEQVDNTEDEDLEMIRNLSEIFSDLLKEKPETKKEEIDKLISILLSK